MISGVRLLSARVPSALGIHPETFNTMWWDIPEQFRSVEELKESLALWFTPNVRERIVQTVIVDHKSRLPPTGVTQACSPACEMRGEPAWSFCSGTDERVDWDAVRRRVSPVEGGGVDLDETQVDGVVTTPASKKNKNRRKKRKAAVEVADDDAAFEAGVPDDGVLASSTAPDSAPPSAPCANSMAIPYQPAVLGPSDGGHDGRGFLQGINKDTLNPTWYCDLTRIPVNEIQARLIGLFRRPPGNFTLPGSIVPNVHFVQEVQKQIDGHTGPGPSECSSSCDRGAEVNRTYFYTTASGEPLPIQEVTKLRNEQRALANEHLITSATPTPGRSMMWPFGWGSLMTPAIPQGAGTPSRQRDQEEGGPPPVGLGDHTLATPTPFTLGTASSNANDLDDSQTPTTLKKKKKKGKLASATSPSPPTPSAPCANASAKPYQPATLDPSDKDWHDGRGFLQGIDYVTLNPVWQCDLTPIPVAEIQRRLIGLFRRPAGYMIVPGTKVPTMRFVEDIKKSMMDPRGPAAPRCSLTCDRPAAERYFYTTASAQPLPSAEIGRIREQQRDLANRHVVSSAWERVQPTLREGEKKMLRFGWEPIPGSVVNGPLLDGQEAADLVVVGGPNERNPVTPSLLMPGTSGRPTTDLEEGTAPTARKKKKKKSKKRTSNVQPVLVGLDEGEPTFDHLEQRSDSELAAFVDGSLSAPPNDIQHGLAEDSSIESGQKALPPGPCRNVIVPRFEPRTFSPARHNGSDIRRPILGLDHTMEPAWFCDVKGMSSARVKQGLESFFSKAGRTAFYLNFEYHVLNSDIPSPKCTDRCNREIYEGQSLHLYTTASRDPLNKGKLEDLLNVDQPALVAAILRLGSSQVRATAKMALMRLHMGAFAKAQQSETVNEGPGTIRSLFWTFRPPQEASGSRVEEPRIEDLSDSWMKNSDDDKVPTTTRKKQKKKKGKGKAKQIKPPVALPPHPRDSTFNEDSVHDGDSVHADDELDTADLVRPATPSTGATVAEPKDRRGLPVVGREQTCFCDECMNPPARYARLDDTDLEDD